MLKQFERELLEESWNHVREGLEVQVCESPVGDEETFILYRNHDRLEKEKAINSRFESRIDGGLKKIKSGCEKKNQSAVKIAERVGPLKRANSHTARLFDVKVEENKNGRAKLTWNNKESYRRWTTLTDGCYIWRSNVTDWSSEELWQVIIQLTKAELAFRIQKSDLRIRTVWHQKEGRVLTHILVCFLAYVLWKTLAQMCRAVGLGDEPRRLFDEIGQLRMMDVVLPTSEGIEIRPRCITCPNEHQAILLDHLGLEPPRQMETSDL